MSYQQKKFKEIANAIREKTGTTEKIKPSEFASKIDDVYVAGQNAGGGGYDEGFEDGKAAEYDAFWDAFQNNGNRTNYYMAFPYWEDACYNPKYPIVTASSGTVANMMFDSAKITDTRVDIFVNCSTAASMFRVCKNLKTVKRLVLTENTTAFGNFATNCTALENLNVEGVINGSIDLHWSPLTRESVEKVVAALSSSATGLTVTFNNTQMENINGGSNWWVDLKATKPNWSFALADI